MRWFHRGLAITAAVAALHGAVWAYAGARLEAEVAVTLDGLRRQGWVAVADAPRRTGWPLAAGVRYREVLLDGTSAGVPAAWSADDVDLSIHAAQPGTLLVALGGAQRWRLGRADWVQVTAASLLLNVDAANANAAGRDIVVHLPGGPVGIAGMHADLKGRSLRLDLTGIEAGPLLPAGRAMIEAALTGPLRPGPDPAAAAAAWRDGGGTVQVNRLMLEAGDLQASASGTGGLDATLQPVLDLTARVQGYRTALDRLVQAQVIQASAAVAAKAVLGLLSGRDPSAPATLPVHVAGGIVSVAGFPLLRVPGIDWMAEPPR